MSSKGPVPATILTGFLGAGKTTLLNHILQNEARCRFGVIVNEFGEIGIDDQLIEVRDEELVLLRNGCVCCTVRKDLAQAIARLLDRADLDYILVETTGLADPGPIAQTFLKLPSMAGRVRLDSVVTLVDPEHIDLQLEEEGVARRQVAMADFLLVNKTDLVSPETLERVEGLLRSINPLASVRRCAHATVDLPAILDVRAFDADRRLSVDPALLDDIRRHDHGSARAVCLRMSGLFDAVRFQSFLQGLSQRRRVYRSKGILAIAGNPHRAVFHGVNNRFTIYWDRPWAAGEPKESQLVFIGKGLEHDALEAALKDCTLMGSTCA